MSCLDQNNPCQEINPCYDDCGCLNPTTFECITKPGTLVNLGVTNDMNGTQVLERINRLVTHPYILLTQVQRTSLLMNSSMIGMHVYQTDGGPDAEGVWVYKSTGWTRAY